MLNCISDLLPCGKSHMPCPWVCSEADPKSLQIGVVLWAGIFLWRDKRSGKSCVCDHAVQGEKPSRSANTQERDCTSDRVDPLSQREQAGNPCDDDRDKAYRHQCSKVVDHFSHTLIMQSTIRCHDAHITDHIAI